MNDTHNQEEAMIPITTTTYQRFQADRSELGQRVAVALHQEAQPDHQAVRFRIHEATGQTPRSPGALTQRWPDHDEPKA